MVAQPEPGSKLRLTILVEKPRVEKAYAKLYRDLSDRGDVPGFRRGHVPPWRARRHYGAEICDQSVFAELLEEALGAALAYGDLHAVEPAGFEDEQSAKEGEALRIDTTLKVRPEAHIPDFAGLELEVPDAEPSEEQIEEAIRNLRDTAAEVVSVDRQEVQSGDLIDVTLKTRVEGEEDEEEREESFIVGEGRYDPPLDAPFIGRSVGETFSFEADYPDRPSMGDLAGKKVAITASVKRLQERHVPELDDEFAARAAEGAGNVAELREKVVEQVRRSNEDLAEAVLHSRAARWLADNVRIDLPEELQEAALVADLAEAEGKAEQDAREALLLYLACETLLRERGVAVSDTDMQTEYVLTGARAGLSPQQLVNERIPSEVESLLRERVVRRRGIEIVAAAATRKVVPMAEALGAEGESAESNVEAEGSEVVSEENDG